MSFFTSVSNITLQTFMIFIYVIDVILAFTVIFLERKSATSSIAWIIVLFLIPGFGIILYFFFSQNIARRKLFKLSKHEKKLIKPRIKDQIRNIATGKFNYKSKSAETWWDMINFNLKYSESYLTDGNEVKILTDGHVMFNTLLSDIEQATDYINIQYFIIKNDGTGRRLIDALAKKAREGVQVRLLVDAMGSRQMSERVLLPLKEAGGQYAFFFSPRIKHLYVTFNYRNHRKQVVIDGDIGYLGGFNIGNEYLGLKAKFGYWRDTHLRIRGEALKELNARFILDWRFTTRKDLPLDFAYRFVYAKGEEKQAKVPMQIVNSGPDSYKAEIKHSYMKMITNARKSIYIQTPYFVPDTSVFDALMVAAESGVDVRIMIPDKPDHMFVYWATFYWCGLLISSGVKIYVYRNGFLHAKTICVDSEVCSIGSANFDIRSFKLNFEGNAFIYDSTTTVEMENIYEKDMERSELVTLAKYNSRPIRIRIKERISKLLSEVL